MNQEELKQSAGILALARVRNQSIDGLPDGYRPADVAEAYQVQEQLHELLDEAGYGKRVGYKIGCTTEVMQQFLGIDTPVRWRNLQHSYQLHCRVGTVR